jgi:uncharacterized protein (DUF302 family)
MSGVRLIKSTPRSSCLSRGDSPAGSRKGRPAIPSIALGAMASAMLIAGLSGCKSMPTAPVAQQPTCDSITTVHESKHGNIDRTCEALRAAIEAKGLKCLKIRDTTESVAKGGIQLDRQVRVIEWCKSQYAHDMLKDNPEVSALLPCAFGIYDGDDGKVYISALNMRLIGNVFGGSIARVMGGPVARKQAAILAAHTR